MKLTTSTGVAVFLVGANIGPEEQQQSFAWIQQECFPGKDCINLLSNTLPADLPKDLTEHLLGLQHRHPDSQFMVVRPLAS